MNPHELSRLTGNDCIVFILFFFLKTAVDNSLRYIWKMGNIKDTMLAADQHREDRINILHLTLSQQPRALLQEELGTFAYLDCHNQSASTQ